jgi:hypothetical protein
MSAASVDSQFPVDPRYAGPSPGGSRSGLINPLMNDVRRASAASVDSQFPVDPRYAGPLAGRLAPLLAIPRRSPLRGAPRRVARTHLK